MSERDWQNRVVDYALHKRWKVFHDRDSRQNPGGLPDLILLRERVVWVELKTRTGRVNQAQRVFHVALRNAGAEFHLWRPEHWDQVMAVLA